MVRYWTIPVVAMLMSAVAAAQTAPPPAIDTARALQEKYDRVRDFTANFTHAYQGGVLKKSLSESGTVEVKKPGRMRWDYSQPEKKLFVSDGHKIYSYVPADKQVIVSSVPPEDQATTGVLFLAGKGNVTRDFKVSYAPGGSDDTWALRLDPKSAAARLRLADPGGRSTLAADPRVVGCRPAGRHLHVPVHQLPREHGVVRGALQFQDSAGCRCHRC